MIRATFGTIPDRETFDRLFLAACGETMTVTLGATDAATLARAEQYAAREQYDEFMPPGPGEWTPRDTFNALSALVGLWGEGDDAAGSLASDLARLMGVDWV